jgi:D-alanine-D-alanine ligase
MSFKTSNPLNVSVIMGGTSLEREISLESGSAVAEALRQAGHQVAEIDLQSNALPAIPAESDCVFPVLHGEFGEDGQIQKLLENANIIYVGCDSKASDLLMDKNQTAQAAEANSIRMPKGITLTDKSADFPDGFTLPVIVKPARQGSSFGLSLVKDLRDWNSALENVFQTDDAAIVQEFIDGTEIAVGVVLNEAMPVVEIIPPGDLFDLDAKYAHENGHTEYNCPPKRLSEEIQSTAQKEAVKCYNVFNCRDMTRMDFIIRGEEIFFIEGNTIPGFTASSLLPKSAAVAGFSFPELCDRLVQAACKRKGM